MSDPIVTLINELDGLRESRDDAWQIPRVEGDLLHHIALACNAKTIVEVGTSYGFSALFWARALKRTGGHLHTIDIDPKKYESAQRTFARAGLREVVMSHLGDARMVLNAISGPIDIAFIDADKPSTREYFDLVWPKIRVGGSVVTDNATTHRAELADFTRYVRSLPETASCEVAIGNGIEWTIRIL